MAKTHKLSTTRLLLFSTFFLGLKASYALASPNLPLKPIITSQNTRQAKKNEKLILATLHKLNVIGQKKEQPTPKNLSAYFSSNIHYAVNGTLLAKNIQQLSSHFDTLLPHYKSMSIVFPLSNLISATIHNTAAISYKINIAQPSGKTYKDKAIVILRIKRHKISRWNAIIAHV